jgi:hypothetical protein
MRKPDFQGRTRVLIVGGGLGGCAAAMACASLGVPTLLAADPDEWLGGQLTAQAVPPDEHRWIEQQGCTRRYRLLRDSIRDFYRRYYPLTDAARAEPYLNPGGGWVSGLCCEPRVALHVLEGMLAYPQMRGNLGIWRMFPIDADTDGDRIRGVLFQLPEQPANYFVEADYILDATETGELLPIAGVEFVTGAESQRDTGEPHAKPEAEPHNMQAFTWCFAMGYDPDGDYVGSKPRDYDFWKAYQPPFWHAPFFSWTDVNPITLEPRRLSLFGEDGTPAMFRYRQIVNPDLYPPDRAPRPVTIVNWPQNDYFLGNLYPPAGAENTPSTGSRRSRRGNCPSACCIGCRRRRRVPTAASATRGCTYALKSSARRGCTPALRRPSMCASRGASRRASRFWNSMSAQSVALARHWRSRSPTASASGTIGLTCTPAQAATTTSTSPRCRSRFRWAR